MNCIHCGCTYHDGAVFCVNCGKKLHIHPLTETLKHPLFLVICILVSVSTGLNFLSQLSEIDASLSEGSLLPLRILFTIFLWLCYAKACKGAVPTGNLRQVSGTFFALQMIGYVMAGVLLSGAVFLLALSAFEVLNVAWTKESFNADVEFDLFLFFAVFLIFWALGSVLLVINLFGGQRIHRFLKALSQDTEDAKILSAQAKTVSIWMMIFGIGTAVCYMPDVLSDLAWCLTGCIDGAVWILCSILVRNHRQKL